MAVALAALATLALAISCRGFFVNPTVANITIDPPSPSVSIGFNTQLTAAATDSDGNPLTLTGGTSCTGTTVCWSSATPGVATVSTGGLLTGVTAGTSTITAASGTVSATTTATVTLGNVTALMIAGQPGNITSFTLTQSSTATGDQCLVAEATAGGTQVDVTASVSWQTDNSTLLTVQNNVDPMCVLAGTATTNTTAHISATYVSNGTTITSNAVTVTVTP